ncbi:TetR/AcrR family transcriptional regulator [Deinococcus oregonensis]|uniref:TetR/AcrR family transcriptional regulator n=1 Tax=Deinococcus oregonensis TaxID=1805970 RepID=A0ABV6B1D8_9DEIO
MKVDREEQDDARRERIARAAFELFARSGLDQTSAQDIARAAFVSRTNLYRYYPSKIHMLLAHFERTVTDTRDEAIRRLGAGSPPQAVWGQVTARMADLGVRYRHLVGAVGQAVLGARHDALAEAPASAGQNAARSGGATAEANPAVHDIRTAVTLVALVEPVLIAMRHQGHIRPDTNTQFLASLFVDACLLALLHGGHRNQREVLRDWQDRFTLIMHGALAPGLTVAAIDGQVTARLTLETPETAKA